jgi:hypothetical protein
MNIAFPYMMCQVAVFCGSVGWEKEVDHCTEIFLTQLREKISAARCDGIDEINS